MANTVIARFPNTTSGRAQALGILDRAGLDATTLIEAGAELLIQQFNFAGDEAAAKERFGEGVEFTDHRAKKGKPGAADFPTEVTIKGVDAPIPVPASARANQVDPEISAVGSAPPQDVGQPDTADAPSPHLTGAAQSQATSDKEQASK